MAKSKKSTRKTATAHEKAVLKAAKARGLINIDLRKPLSAYARKQVSKFEPVYRQEASVVKLDAKGKKKYKGTVEIRKGYAIVPKTDVRQSARYNKKTGDIIVGGKVLTPSEITFPDLPPGKRYVVPFKTGNGTTTRGFSGPGAGAEMSAQMATYEEAQGGTFDDWQDFVYVDDDPFYDGDDDYEDE